MHYEPIEVIKERYIREFDRIWDVLMKTYPKRFKELRQGAKFGVNISQTEMAEILASHPEVRIKKSMYSRLEGGVIVPPIKTFIALMALHNVTLGQAAGLESLGDRAGVDDKRYQEKESLRFTEALEKASEYLALEAKKRKHEEND